MSLYTTNGKENKVKLISILKETLGKNYNESKEME